MARYALFKDRSGKIWIGADESLCKYDPETERFSHLFALLWFEETAWVAPVPTWHSGRAMALPERVTDPLQAANQGC
jgi:hypothetical protein